MPRPAPNIRSVYFSPISYISPATKAKIVRQRGAY